MGFVGLKCAIGGGWPVFLEREKEVAVYLYLMLDMNTLTSRDLAYWRGSHIDIYISSKATEFEGE